MRFLGVRRSGGRSSTRLRHCWRWSQERSMGWSRRVGWCARRCDLCVVFGTIPPPAPRDVPDRNITEDQSDVNDTVIAEHARRQTDRTHPARAGDRRYDRLFGTARLTRSDRARVDRLAARGGDGWRRRGHGTATTMAPEGSTALVVQVGRVPPACSHVTDWSDHRGGKRPPARRTIPNVSGLARRQVRDALRRTLAAPHRCLDGATDDSHHDPIARPS